jgi:glycosyltransferase involved in cell wall biosynthesis
MFAVQVAVMKGQGGVFTSLFHYARMWDANGVKSVCLYRGPGADLLRAGGIDVIEAPDSLQSPLFRLTPDFARLRAEIRKRGGDPDCVMAHSDRTIRQMKALFPNAVVMTRCHSDNFKHKRPAHLIVTLNEEQQQMVQAGLAGARVRMFGNPFVPAPNDPGPRDQPGPNGRLRFNFIGRVEQVKDPLTLVRAFLSADLKPDTELRIIGAGSQDDEIKGIAATASRKVEHAGWLEHPFSHFDADDILVLPSEWESYSWVIREALFHGVPVIASDIYVHRDALGGGQYGWLFPIGDDVALKLLLQRAEAERGALRAMTLAGREALLARYGAVPFWRGLSAEIAAIRAERRR